MADIIVLTAMIIALVVVVFYFILKGLKKQSAPEISGETYKELLQENIPFYQGLSEEDKDRFASRVAHFLSQVRITGVHTSVQDLDKVLVAASAIIPIFRFPDWEYTNLHEVLLYPETFNDEFELTGTGRSVLGMVGEGPMQHVMILSQHELHQGFLNRTGKTNTAIHEFVHLVDKTDGSTDGIPENIIKQQYVVPWLNLMHRKIAEIRKGKSDINPYGSTNEAEFLAVASEYFFERPDLLKEKHPELFRLLEEIFHQEKVKDRTEP